MPEAYAASIERLRSLAGTPRDPHGHVFAVIAEYLRRDGKLDEAKEVLDRGLAIAPEFASGYVAAAQVLTELGELDQAREALDRLAQLDRENSRAPALSEAVNKAEEAAALDWARAQGVGPAVEVDDEVVTVTLGELYLEQGAADRAEQVALHLLQEDSTHEGARALLERAQAYGAPTPTADVLEPEATDIVELAPDPVEIASLAPDPVAIESLGPTVVPVAELAPDGVPVAELAPDEVPVAALAPDEVPVASLAPDETSEPQPVAPAEPDADSKPDDLSDFMSWLDDN